MKYKKFNFSITHAEIEKHLEKLNHDDGRNKLIEACTEIVHFIPDHYKNGLIVRYNTPQNITKSKAREIVLNKAAGDLLIVKKILRKKPITTLPKEVCEFINKPKPFINNWTHQEVDDYISCVALDNLIADAAYSEDVINLLKDNAIERLKIELKLTMLLYRGCYKLINNLN